MVKKFFYRIFCGFFLGLSVLAPGFSGSVIAIVTGIYQDLVRIISNPFKNKKQNFLFCLPLAIGAVFGLVLFIISFKLLFDSYEKATYLLCVGLIAGNLPVIYKEVRKRRFKKRYWAGSIGAFAVALALGLFVAKTGHASGAEGISSSLLILAVSGFLGGSSILVPGMNASMILILFGVYDDIIFSANSLLRLDFAYLVPFGVFGVCAIVGLVLSSRGIKFVFEEHTGFANSTVLGFMVGSLAAILLQSLKLHDDHFTWLLGGIALAVGFGISMLFVVLGKHMNKE